MSDASEKLARSRRAILDQIARRQRRHDPHEQPSGSTTGEEDYEEPADADANWFAHMRHAVGTWWRYHPAHMVADLASPLMREYARRKPVQLLAISAGLGAALTMARPWRLISVTTLVVALLKSSQLSGLLMAALSAADYRKDNDRP